MNWSRILRISNYFLLLSGFQLHRFEPGTHRYRLSLWGVVNYLVLTLFYIICVNQHFAQSPLLNIFHEVSPFFWHLIRAQILLGLKVYIFRLFTMADVGRACDTLSRLSARTLERKFSIAEAFAYFLIFSTFLIALCFALYITFEMEFKMPPWDNIFISFGLLIPHFALAGALKLYTLNCWLLRDELRQLKTGLDVMIGADDKIGMEIGINVINTCMNMASNDVHKQLEEHYKRFKQIANALQLVSVGLNKELMLLLVMNGSCLLAGVYTLIYFETSWYLLFSVAWKRIFYAANLAIYVLIFWDYLCLCISTGCYNKIKYQILARVQVALKSKIFMEKRARAALKGMRNVLAFELRLRLFDVADVSTANLVLANILLGIIISLVVMYQYLNDQIVSVEARLDMFKSDG